MQDITLLNATYNDVPAVQLPKSGGGLASFTDVTDTTATASDVAQGKYFYDSAGVRTEGTASGGGGTWHKDDDKTHLYIDIPNSVLCDVNLSFTQTVSGGHTIDWGDNTTPTTPTSTSTSLISHTYAQAGEYEIVITNTSGYFSLGNTSTTKGYIFQETGGNTQHDRYYARPAMLKKMELGKGWDCSKSRQFSNCRQLTEVYVNKKPDQTSFGTYLFDQCRKLASITGINGWDASITSCGQNAFASCPFDVPYIPSNLTAIPNNYLTQSSTSYCASALKLDLTGVQTIGSSAFAFLALLSELDIPSSVTQIGASAFKACSGLQVIHLRRSTPPTLDNANAFSITSSSAHSCVMYVPSGKLNDYQTASNWSTFASYMQEEPS